MSLGRERRERQTYWVIQGKLMAGFYPGSPDPAEARRKIEDLVELGIRRFVDLTEEGESTPYAALPPYTPVLRAVEGAKSLRLTYQRHPVPDLDVPGPGQMERILDTLDRGLREGEPVYVHCHGGRGRTGTVVACYFIRHAEALLSTANPDLAPALALEKLVGLRQQQAVYEPDDSPQTDVQFAFVRSWGVGM